MASEFDKSVLQRSSNRIRIWASGYSKQYFISDLTAAVVVTVLLIPQSLAYAMLAGLPMEIGLYSSILPLIAYAMLGSSRTLSVGPVAVLALMTSATLTPYAAQGSAEYIGGAIILAGMSGIMLAIIGLLRLGFIANFLSHSVISGFITASGIIIALSQFKHIFGINVSGDTLPELIFSFYENYAGMHGLTLVFGLVAILYLLVTRFYAESFFIRWGMTKTAAVMLAKTAPILAVAVSIIVVSVFGLQQKGVAVTGLIPSGLPSLMVPELNLALVRPLFLPALMLAIIGYVESISVGKLLAARRQQKIMPNRELLGLGAANLVAACSGGMPVTGGFSRTIVNFQAGAVTQVASVMAAIGIALAAGFLTPYLYYLPKAMLAATIVIAVLGLVDFGIFFKTWKYEKKDFWAVMVTVLMTLFAGVEIGVASGVILSLVVYLYQTSRPHIAEVGLLEGSEHFRNVLRHKTVVLPNLLSVRMDESLFFANASELEDFIRFRVVQRPAVRHVVLVCSAINDIDYSALEMLEQLDRQLQSQNVHLHLSEVKGPVMDKLRRAEFLRHLSGQVFISQFDAFRYVQSICTQ